MVRVWRLERSRNQLKIFHVFYFSWVSEFLNHSENPLLTLFGDWVRERITSWPVRLMAWKATTDQSSDRSLGEPSLARSILTSMKEHFELIRHIINPTRHRQVDENLQDIFATYSTILFFPLSCNAFCSIFPILLSMMVWKKVTSVSKDSRLWDACFPTQNNFFWLRVFLANECLKQVLLF